ncbi:DUF4442 domain-containing protein [Fluviispira multicolorata]|uniref:DUF4442 domain-containing protein n=1 Tax=Fluviispira multicolorata TaxID=2654512 RepID=A0A833N6I7_9BACT|nr:DUF4442 domain-containing protein [Fluviispira multicolorata]KAB8030608.1 DUF4442 domain-containing protein [Fluviispira multicolorata]
MSKFLPNFSSPSEMIKIGWEKLNKLPAGNIIFSSLVSKYIPYTGSISPVVLKIENGLAQVRIKDKRAIRNHLKCIHAIALANIGEFSTGLSITSQLPNSAKGILVRIEIEYLKKARGDLIAEANFQLPKQFKSEDEFKIVSNIKDSKNIIVSKVYATWKVRI